MDKLYQRINYENSPSKKTPLNETNLNKMDKAIDDLDNRIIEQDAAFAKSIAAEDKKIAAVDSRVSVLTDTAATLTQSKSDAIVCSASGETIIATDSADAGFEGMKLFGWGKQEKTSGKQLLNLRDGNSGIGDGVTYTNRGDGSYTRVGTATGAQGNIWLWGGWVRKPADDDSNVLLTLKTGKTYSIMDCSLYSTDSDGNPLSLIVGTYTPSEEFKVTGVRNQSMSIGATYNDVVYPRVFEGSVDLGWEPYTNGPSPNPEYQQPIVSAGQMLAKGNQLLPNGLSLMNDGNYITSGEITLPAGSYTFSAKKNNSTSFYYWINVNGSSVVENTTSANAFASAFTLTEESTVQMSGRYNPTAPINLSDFTEAMLNKGTSALPWEPYTGGVKKAYDVGIGKRVTGKNLANPKAFVRGILPSGTNGDFANSYIWHTSEFMDVSKFKSVVISANMNVVRFTGYDANKNIIWFNGNIVMPDSFNPYVKELPEDTKYIRISAGLDGKNWSSIDDLFKEYWVQVEPGTEATPYEPYTEQTLHIAKVFNSIEVTDASLATYTDADGKMWCADCRDYEREVDVQRTVKTVYDGSEDEGWNISSITGRYALNMGARANSPCLCTHALNIVDGLVNHCYINNYGQFFIDTEFATIEEWKAHLASNPMEILRLRTTPIETPIPEAEMAEWRALHSNKPTTVITNSAGCMMEIKYVADPKNYIAQNYVPISKYTALEERVSALEQLHV